MGKGKKKAVKESHILNCQKMHSYLLRKSDGFEQALKKYLMWLAVICAWLPRSPYQT